MHLADDNLFNRVLIVFIAVIALALMVLVLIVGYAFFDAYETKILSALYIGFMVWLVMTLFWYCGFLHHDLVRRHLRNESVRSRIAFEINQLPCPAEEEDETAEGEDFYTTPAHETQGRGEDLGSLFERKWG